MRPAALSIAVLLGIAAWAAAAEARAMPTLGATITIEGERTVLVGGKRHQATASIAAEGSIATRAWPGTTSAGTTAGIIAPPSSPSASTGRRW